MICFRWENTLLLDQSMEYNERDLIDQFKDRLRWSTKQANLSRYTRDSKSINSGLFGHQWKTWVIAAGKGQEGKMLLFLFIPSFPPPNPCISRRIVYLEEYISLNVDPTYLRTSRTLLPASEHYAITCSAYIDIVENLASSQVSALLRTDQAQRVL